MLPACNSSLSEPYKGEIGSVGVGSDALVLKEGTPARSRKKASLDRRRQFEVETALN